MLCDGMTGTATEPVLIPATRRARPTGSVLGAYLTVVPVAVAAFLMAPDDPGLSAVLLALAGAIIAALSVTLVLLLIQLRRAARGLAAAEAGARHRMTHDGLTGLPNLVAFRAELAGRLGAPAAGSAPRAVVVLFLDCDRFGLINDTWGGQAGDALLRTVAARLRAVTAAGEALARVGGDKFVLAAEVALDAGDLPGAGGDRLGGEVAGVVGIRIAQRLLDAFAPTWELPGGHHVAMSASIGVAYARCGDPVSADDLLRDADIARSSLKDSGRGGVALFDASLRERITRRAVLGQELRGAVERGEFEVHYQPIVAAGGTVPVQPAPAGAGLAGAGLVGAGLVGFEALVRWRHPSRGLVSPAVFIEVAEETGLISEIGCWVLRQACRELAGWRGQAGGRDLHMAVNVSARQILRDDLVGSVADVLAETGLPPAALWLEMTESVLVRRTDEALAVLAELRRRGVTLAIDDFGTGYSAMGYLRDFPASVVKIDQSFVAGLGVDPTAAAIIQAVLTMAHGLGMTVVAEGVETVDQADRLAAAGCDLFQGWLFGRPVPAVDVRLPAGWTTISCGAPDDTAA